MIHKIAFVGTIALLTLTSISTQAQPYSRECRFTSNRQEITDKDCEVIYEGSLDDQYGRMRTFVPKKATVIWFDGLKTRITFKEILEISGAARSGTAIVDGYTYQFIAFGTGGYSFKRINSKTGEVRVISWNKWTGRAR